MKRRADIAKRSEKKSHMYCLHCCWPQNAESWYDTFPVVHTFLFSHSLSSFRCNGFYRSIPICNERIYFQTQMKSYYMLWVDVSCPLSRFYQLSFRADFFFILCTHKKNLIITRNRFFHFAKYRKNAWLCVPNWKNRFPHYNFADMMLCSCVLYCRFISSCR